MWFQYIKQKGMTLLEIMLVLAIASAVIILGFQQYESFRLGQNLNIARSNVDIMFQGGLNYYRANCHSGGTLDPIQIANFGVPVTNGTSYILISYITTPNLLGISLPPIPSGIVDASDQDASGNNTYGYRVQINTMRSPPPALQASGTTRQTYSCYTDYTVTPAVTTCGGIGPILKLNSVVSQMTQVSVKLLNPNPTIATAYKNILGADCVSSLYPGSTSVVAPCGVAGTGAGGTFLVWQRWPTAGAFPSSSVMSLSDQRLKQFNQLYNNDDFYALQVNDSTWNDPPSPGGGGLGSRYQDYLCTGS